MKARWIVLSIIAATLILVPAVLLAQSPKQTQTQPVQQIQTIQLNADTIFNLVNAERAKNGLKPLIRDARLDQSAQQKVDDMVANNYFGHVNPTTEKHGYEYIPKGLCSLASENIIDSSTNNGAVKWWMNSKPHHDAILLQEYTHAGVATNGNFGVQHFCTIK